MTAEIAILNRHAIALAADSAVTVGRRRTWKTANKLFSLSPVNDIGLMIYGAGEFNGYSWEIIAKTFREHVGSTVFNTVSECGNEFFNYLGSSKFDLPESENINVVALIYDMLERIKEDVGKQGSEDDHSDKLEDVIGKHIEFLNENYERLECPIDKSQFDEYYSDQISNFIGEIFEFPLTKELTNILIELLYMMFASKVESSFATGVVIAGYGANQLFPELIDFRVDGKHHEFVRVWNIREKNFNEDDGTKAMVVPFAQSDMFQLFMEGITTNHLTFIQDTLLRVLNEKSTRLIQDIVSDSNIMATQIELQHQDNEKMLSEFFEEFRSYIQTEMIGPVVNVISTLPKEEMAAMAEALVEITTLRRKVDSTVESVGGPTDVAIISKGDGFVWIKRKYYFDIQLNPDFLTRKRFRHGGKDGT